MKLTKKIFTGITALILICSLATVSVFAETYFVENNFKFKCDSDNNAIIAEYYGKEKNVVIPDELIGSPVIGFEQTAFYENSTMEHITFGKNIKTIPAMCFASSALQEVTLPSTLTALVWGAFQNCTAMTEVKFDNPNITTIPRHCFNGCAQLKNVEISNGITTIEEYAFANCTAEMSVFIPDSVTEISSNAFYNCGNLTIFCAKDSYARTFAEQEGIPYILTDYQIGDVDMDTEITILDATLIQQYLAYLTEFDAQKVYLSDFDNNGKIDILDVTEMQKFIAHLI